jgi:alpha-1,6-mannosyltransferase
MLSRPLMAFSVRARPRLLLALWLSVGAALMLFAGLLLVYAHRFDWQLPVRQMPAATLGVTMAVAGLVYLAVLPLIRLSLAMPEAVQKGLTSLVLAIGFALRLMLFFSEPALEDDYNRYLWEGALTAHAISPYDVSPRDARRAPPHTPLGRLAQQGAPVLARVNHPDLSSNYPPVAQTAFALAYLISPWNLTAWRAVSFACDVATMILLLMLLRAAGRPAIWVALYWWNPIVIKELVNSAHMEGVVLALVLAALLLSAKQKNIWAVSMLGLAIGTKLWPMLLAPLVLRRLWPRFLPLAAAVVLLIAMTLLWLLPALSGDPEFGSGYVAYFRHWTTNSSLFPAIEGLSRLSLRLFGHEESAWAVARAAVALLLGGLSLWQARQPVVSTNDLMRRASLVSFGLVLLSPAQFPWYMIWMIPFLVFRPYWGLLATAVTVPLYYVAFHLLARDAYDIFLNWVVWGIWVPVWLLLGAEVLRETGLATRITPSHEPKAPLAP